MALNKDELLTRGSELIDRINESMATIENTDAAKEKVSCPEARVTITLPLDDEYSDTFELNTILDAKRCDKIKAFIMTELDYVQEDACSVLNRLGIGAPKEEAPAAVPETPKKAAVIDEEFDKLFEPDPESPLDENGALKLKVDKIESVEPTDHGTVKITAQVSKPAAVQGRRLKDDQIREIERATAEGHTISEICAATGFAQMTVRKYVAEYYEKRRSAS